MGFAKCSGDVIIIGFAYSEEHFKESGPLAQLVEQLTLNQLVVGSIPTRPTIFNPLRAILVPSFYQSQ